MSYSNMGTVYGSPENYGLELVFEKDLDEDTWSFNIFAVWKEVSTGRIFIGQDSGCSCPSPFEDYNSVESLEEINLNNLGDLVTRLREYGMSTLTLCEIIDDIHTAVEKEKEKANE